METPYLHSTIVRRLWNHSSSREQLPNPSTDQVGEVIFNTRTSLLMPKFTTSKDIDISMNGPRSRPHHTLVFAIFSREKPKRALR